MLFYLFYFLFSPFIFISLCICALFNQKIRSHFLSYNKSFKTVKKSLKNNKKEVIILHAASAGEFEQIKPILNNLNREKYFIIQSFTSPTIYKKEYNNNLTDVSCYHPFDFLWFSYIFFKTINPKKYVITRHDIWPCHLLIAKKLGVKIFYINCNLHKKSIWLKKIMLQFSKSIFNNIDICIVPSKLIYKKLLSIYDKKKIIICSDTRFEQIINRSKKNSTNKILPNSFLNSFNIIFGSYDLYDEPIIFDSIKKKYPNGLDDLKINNQRLIFVPHEVDSSTINRTINKLESLFFSPNLYSQKNFDSRVLVVDVVGILADIYKYTKLAYVGSGFNDGVHSVIEPAIYGCAIGYGPEIELLDEAKYINENDMGIMINDKLDMVSFLNLFSKPEKIKSLGNKVKSYVIENNNSSKKIIEIIDNAHTL